MAGAMPSVSLPLFFSLVPATAGTQGHNRDSPIVSGFPLARE
jgi:hypothetical protein